MSYPSIIPAMRYRNCLQAIEWLCTHLGFTKHVVFESEGIVHHAELLHGNGMIMLGSYRDGPFDQLVKLPSEMDNYNTQSAYIYVTNLTEHYEYATTHGLEIVLPLKKEPHGSGYTCRDPEGYLWSFGDFNPWMNEANK